MIPPPSINPGVAFPPTGEQALDGRTIEPSVSVPTPTVARLAAIATPVPELEPQGLRSSAYGFLHWPPRPLHPDTEWVERKLAHSERFVLPRITAPAARRRPATAASRGGAIPARASAPAVVLIRPALAMVFLMGTGMAGGRPRRLPGLPCRSSCA